MLWTIPRYVALTSTTWAGLNVTSVSILRGFTLETFSASSHGLPQPPSRTPGLDDFRGSHFSARHDHLSDRWAPFLLFHRCCDGIVLRRLNVPFAVNSAGHEWPRKPTDLMRNSRRVKTPETAALLRTKRSAESDRLVD